MALLQDALTIMKILHSRGYEAYIVGGFVRDYLLNRPTNDIDIATNAMPETVRTLFPKTFLTGLKHGTVTVLHHHCQYEITTFRTEGGYTDLRRPDEVIFVSSLKEDILRRDFTMNALAFDSELNLIDYVGGKQDIENKQIRCVGNAEKRFSEDALRMLRALRFQALLGFSIDESSLKAIEKQKELLKKISQERIIGELTKMLAGKHFPAALATLVQLNVQNALRFAKGLGLLKNSGFVPRDFTEFLSVCEIAGDDLSGLPLSRVQVKAKTARVTLFKDADYFSTVTIFNCGIEVCLSVNRLNIGVRSLPDKSSEIMRNYESLPIKTAKELQIKGNELTMLLNRKAGPWINELLQDLCLKILNRELKNDSQEIRQYLLKSH